MAQLARHHVRTDIASETAQIEDARTLNFLAIAQMLYRRDEAALNYLSLSNVILADHPPTLRLLVKVFFRTGQDDRVIETVLDLERLGAIETPDEITELKGRALARLGLISAARGTLAV
ncbi:MAG: hypothetical protein WBG95_05225 [Sulfitobacter sp.]